MKRQIFDKGMFALAKAFPGYTFDSQFCWRNLNDLEDQEFINSVDYVVKNVTDLFNTSNIVAIIRQRNREEKHCQQCNSTGSYQNHRGYKVFCECPLGRQKNKQAKGRR